MSDETNYVFLNLNNEVVNQEPNANFLEVPTTSRARNNSEVEYDIVVQPSTLFLPEEPLQVNPLVEQSLHNRDKYYTRTPKKDVVPSDEYLKPSAEPGEVFIFNFEQTLSGPRDGTRIDVAELIDTLGRLKFNISKNRIYNNLTTEQVLSSIQAVTTELEEHPVNCLIVIFLTHGTTDNIIETKNGRIAVERIVHAFQCDALKGVPQWFTILACKQSEKDAFLVDPSLEVVSRKSFERLPQDIIIYFSTTEGNKSARRYEHGTWVIQELCRNLNGYGRRDDIIGILTRTNKCIANNYNADGHQQVPVILSTLTKKFFLTLSKERLGILEALQKLQELNRH